MPKPLSRRDFLKSTAATGLCAPLSRAVSPSASASDLTFAPVSTAPAAHLPIQKGVLLEMLPKDLSYAARLNMARDAGFEVIQAPTIPDQHEADEIKRAAESAGIRIDSVMNKAHWQYPLSSSDPEAVRKSLDGMKTSLHNASFWGARTVLLVPAVVNENTSYQAAWERSQKQIRTLIPLAEQVGVVIAIEEVWNRFLLSPLEFARYIDQFHSPWIKAWFDVGNVVLYGYPQDWIRTLGNRIVEVHVKDFKRTGNCHKWVNLGDGDVNWPEVRKALTEIGYSGCATAELEPGDQAYLRDVRERMDKLVCGA